MTFSAKWAELDGAAFGDSRAARSLGHSRQWATLAGGQNKTRGQARTSAPTPIVPVLGESAQEALNGWQSCNESKHLGARRGCSWLSGLLTRPRDGHPLLLGSLRECGERECCNSPADTLLIGFRAKCQTAMWAPARIQISAKEFVVDGVGRS